ncbi:MAG: hypothetical protein M3Y27_29080 [Acidobacteriota bacterium]|nr:hypothetical protein [Acidobacteriota bacterium]
MRVILTPASVLLAATAIVFAPCLHGQAFDPQAFLERVSARVASNVQHMPRYSCEEVVERFWYRSREAGPGCAAKRSEKIGLALLRSDRLRLDVAIGSGREMFAWHGDRSFRAGDIDELVRAGPIGSGTFFSFLSNIFAEDRATAEFRGMKDHDGAKSAVFGYDMPVDNSTFQVRTESGKEVVGYDGSFSVDVATGNLRTLEVHSNNLPKDTLICSVDIQVDYSTTRLGHSDLELPDTVVMDIADFNHGRTHTVTSYRQCREFVGESVLRFDDNPPRETARARPRPILAVPAGRSLKIRILSSIHPETAWGGDRIDGVLLTDVEGENGSVLVTKGTPVSGHLLRVERLEPRGYAYNIDLQFDEITSGGINHPFDLKSVMAPFRLDSNGNPLTERLQLYKPDSGRTRPCRFRINNKSVKLKNVVTYWVTAAHYS